VSGLPIEEISRFFAGGMLMNVLMSMQAPGEQWGRDLMDGCKT
jgi:hypothetical protein